MSGWWVRSPCCHLRALITPCWGTQPFRTTLGAMVEGGSPSVRASGMARTEMGSSKSDSCQAYLVR